MTTAAGMQVISSDHHLQLHHGHHHAHMLGVVGSAHPFSPAFSFASSSSSSASAAASKPLVCGGGAAEAPWSQQQQQHLNSSSSNASIITAFSARDKSLSSHGSPSSASASSSPSSNLTRPPSPPHTLAATAATYNDACSSDHQPPPAATASSSSPSAAAPPPTAAASVDAATATAVAAASPSRSCHSPSPSPSASPPPPPASSYLSSPDRLLPRSQHGSPNRSVNAPRSSPNHSPNHSPSPSHSLPVPPPFSSFHFKPLSSYQSAPVVMEVDVDEFLKEEQSADMEQFLLELLQPSPTAAAPNSPPPPPPGSVPSLSTSNSTSTSSFARSNSMRHQQQQQQAVGSSSYQTLMEMALDSNNSSFMDAPMHMAMDSSAVSVSYMDAANCKPSAMPSSCSSSGGVKPSFVVSHNNNFGAADASAGSSLPRASAANSVYAAGYMDAATDSKEGVLVYTPTHRTTFLEAMSTKPEQWMNLSTKPSEVDELEKEFMRSLYGSNVNSRMQQSQQQQRDAGGGGGGVRVKSEPMLLRTQASMAHDVTATSMAMAMGMGPLGMDDEAGAGIGGVKMESGELDQFDAGEVGHSDTVMLELDPIIPDSSNNSAAALTSHDMNQLMADAFISSSSGMNLHHHHHHQLEGGLLHQQAVMMPNGGGGSYGHHPSEMDPSMLHMQQQQQGHAYFSHPQQQHKSSNQLVDSCLSSTWPGGGATSGGGGGCGNGNGSSNSSYKHYGQPLAQLKNKKMFTAGGQQSNSSNSSTLALVQALAPASNGSAGGSHYHARRFLNSQSLPNLQHTVSSNGNGGMMAAAAAAAVGGHMGGGADFHAVGQLSRSNSLPSQRGLMHQGSPGQVQQGGSPLGGSPLGGSPLGGSPYLGHSVSFPAEHSSSRGSSYLGPQHRIGSSPSLQSLAGLGGGGGSGGGANSSYSHGHSLHGHHNLHNHHGLSNSASGLTHTHFNSSSLSQLQAADFHPFQQQQQQQHHHHHRNYYRNSGASNGGPDDLSSIMSATATTTNNNMSAAAAAAAAKDSAAAAAAGHANGNGSGNLSTSSSSPVMMATGLQLVHLLIACAEAVADDNMELAHVILERLSTLVVPLGNPMQRLAAYFAEALAARISRKNRGDLYRGLHGDKSVSKIEKIEAMSVLYACVPTGKFGHLTANQVLLDAIDNEQNVHVVDLHIWYGMQWPAFMQALASREGGPPNLRISAVGSSYEELKETGETLLECAKQLNVPLEYCPIVVPLEEFNVRLLEVRRGEVCVVNAFSQLHCLLHKGADNFNRILRGLRSLNPKVFALTENDGNHNSPVFLTRFMECLHYYSAVFDAFEASMPAESTARMKTEQLFAAQTIRNIIACEGTDRVERHETMVEWGKRMETAGFTSVPLSSRAVSQAELLLNLYYSNGYTLANNNGYLALGWHTMPLIGVSAWR